MNEQNNWGFTPNFEQQPQYNQQQNPYGQQPQYSQQQNPYGQQPQYGQSQPAYSSGKKNFKSLIIASICIVVAIAIVIGGYFAIVGTPKSIAKKYIKETVLCNYDKIGKYELITTEEIYNAGAEKSDSDETFEDAIEEAKDDFEDEYGNPKKAKIEFKKLKIKDMKKKDLKELKKGIKSLLKEDEFEDINIDVDKIKAGKEVKIKYKLKGEDGKDTEEGSLYIVKYGMKWKVISPVLELFIPSLYDDDDYDDDDYDDDYDDDDYDDDDYDDDDYDDDDYDYDDDDYYYDDDDFDY